MLRLAPYPAIPLTILTYLPYCKKGLPGLSSVPANSRPNITQSAPKAKALHIFPEFLLPPSEISGMLCSLQTGPTDYRAVNCGTPQPETIQVIQMEPFPIPHLIESAPASIKRFAPSPVATFPAIISTLP